MILRLGSHGDDVRTLQAALRSLGFYRPPAVIDGVFGVITDRAVRAFQEDRALAVDGQVGPATWTALLSVRAPWPQPRCWPLRCLPDGRAPKVTSGFRARNPSRPKHQGVDLMFPYRASDPPTRIGDSGRTKTWWIPEGTLAIAPFAGQVVIAGDSSTGKRVWLKHAGGWNAGFFHLDELAVAVGWTVNMGAPIGRVGDSPRGDDPDHLHFEIVYGDIVDIVKRGLHAERTSDPELFLSVTSYLDAS